MIFNENLNRETMPPPLPSPQISPYSPNLSKKNQLSPNIWGIERSGFSMVGKNGRKVLKTKGFRHDRENGLNISKRFFSLHGLHLLYV